MEKIDVNISENSDSLNVNISENSDNLKINITEGSIVNVSGSYSYKYNFENDNNSTWLLISKHDGYIINSETTNIQTIKINGSEITYPYAIDFNGFYLIEIERITSGVAELTFNLSVNDYSETNDLPNFSEGNGFFTFAISQTVNQLYIIDNRLLTLSNFQSGWIEDPLTIITLPNLPANGKWERAHYVNGDRFLMFGYNSVSKYKYFAFVSLNGTVTDLEGMSNSYTAYLTIVSGINYAAMYDYITNNFYLTLDTYGNQGLSINLNTNRFSNQVNTLINGSVKYKYFFNPYKKCFLTGSEVYVTKPGMYLGTTFNWINKTAINLKTANYIVPNLNYIGYLYEKNQSGDLVQLHTANPITVSGTGNIMADHENSTNVLTGASNKFAIFKISELNNKSFALVNPLVSGTLYDGMFAHDQKHLILDAGFQRLHVIDASDPINTVQPDFAYYDYPTKVFGINTNRIL